MSCDIINYIPNIENYTYLELGVYKNKNFQKIKCFDKFSVDVNGNAMFTGTTDEYFSSISSDKKFDIIFIDANHDYDFVLKDFNNAIDHALKWIILHDMIPPNKNYTASNRCSDSFKLLGYLIEKKFKVYPMDENYGLTLIKTPVDKIYPGENYKNLSFDSFQKFIKKQKLYSREDMIKIFREENVY